MHIVELIVSDRTAWMRRSIWSFAVHICVDPFYLTQLLNHLENKMNGIFFFFFFFLSFFCHLRK